MIFRREHCLFGGKYGTYAVNTGYEENSVSLF
jgi:hypothetical protein